MRLHCTTISDASLVGGTLLIAILNAMKNMQIIYRRRVANGNAQKAALDIGRYEPPGQAIALIFSLLLINF